MKNLRWFTAAFAFTISVVSCKKMEDQYLVEETKAPETAVEWKSVSAWSADDDETSKVFRTSITDNSLTDSVAASGVILAFRKSDNKIESLPFEEKVGDKSFYWYYQIAKGSIDIVVEGPASAEQPDLANGFNYLIISKEKLLDLETKGYSRDQLMTLTYETATTLLK